MKHIRQISSSFEINHTYTIVITDNWNKPLEEHPLILNHSDIYEIADCEIPTNNNLQFEIYDGN